MSDLAIEKWKEFIEWIDKHSVTTCYRGHSDKDYLLLPSVGRDNYSLAKELNMFEHFKRRASMYCNAKDDFEWLALAQHHGLPTRLLDWTENPLVACFFTVLNNPDKDGRIYCLNYRGDDFANLDDVKSPFEIDRIKLLHPPISTRRLELQKGLFTIHPLPHYPCVIDFDKSDNHDKHFLNEVQLCRQCDNRDFKIPNFNSSDLKHDFEGEILKFYKSFYKIEKPFFDIPKECKSYFENKIRSLGIDETIYGDIDSIAKNIKYLGSNNLLRDVKNSNFKSVKPLWQATIPQLLKDYLKNNPKVMNSLFSGFNIIDSQLYFEITDIHRDEYNFKDIIGNLHYHIRPNFEKLKAPVLKNIFYSGYETVIDFFSELKINVFSNGRLIRVNTHQNIQLTLYTNGYSENHLSIVKCQIIPTPDNIEFISDAKSKFEKAEKNLEHLLQQMHKEDIAKLKRTVKGSVIYKQLLDKYRGKIKP